MLRAHGPHRRGDGIDPRCSCISNGISLKFQISLARFSPPLGGAGCRLYHLHRSLNFGFARSTAVSEMIGVAGGARSPSMKGRVEEATAAALVERPQTPSPSPRERERE